MEQVRSSDSLPFVHLLGSLTHRLPCASLPAGQEAGRGGRQGGHCRGAGGAAGAGKHHWGGGAARQRHRPSRSQVRSHCSCLEHGCKGNDTRLRVAAPHAAELLLACRQMLAGRQLVVTGGEWRRRTGTSWGVSLCWFAGALRSSACCCQCMLLALHVACVWRCGTTSLACGAAVGPCCRFEALAACRAVHAVPLAGCDVLLPVSGWSAGCDLLLPACSPPPSRRIKEQVFGATTFWVTETRPLATQSLELGVVVKGNL